MSYREESGAGVEHEHHDGLQGTRSAAGQTPMWPPLAVTVSGLYVSTAAPGLTQEIADVDESALPTAATQGEELRLDVDGRYPQMTASGSIRLTAVERVQWIARLQATGPATYVGGIWYRNPAASPFSYTRVHIAVTTGLTATTRRATVTFAGGGLPDRTRSFAFRSPYFERVELEIDAVQGVAADTAIVTGGHPNRPPTLAAEPLNVETVLRRAGLAVTRNGGDGVVPVAGAGSTARWSDAELHDAMQAYWSRFNSRAQWAAWVLLATQHERGSGIGGITFEGIGNRQRPGVALFYNSFMSDVPAGDPASAACKARMRFWAALHGVGHALRLGHAWQKSAGVPWLPLADEPEARSFMNTPQRVRGGQSAFFSSFEYRFSNPELLVLRHAPDRFGQVGEAGWFEQHGFRQAAVSPEPALSLELRVNRTRPAFEFLEPVVAELKLKNISTEPQLVDQNVLDNLERVTIALKRQGSPARQFAPYARTCSKPSTTVLMPGQSAYASVFLSAGLNGLDLAEPGSYVLQAALHLDDGDIVSAPLVLRVAPPRSFEEEALAQDFFTDEVGRVLAFDGTHLLAPANDTLREIIARLGERRVARHARVALGLPLTRAHRLLSLSGGLNTLLRPAGEIGAKFMEAAAHPDEARAQLSAALTQDADVAAESLGHIEFKQYVDALTDFLATQGERKEASQIQSHTYKILAARGVLPPVLQDVDHRRERYAAAGVSPR